MSDHESTKLYARVLPDLYPPLPFPSQFSQSIDTLK